MINFPYQPYTYVTLPYYDPIETMSHPPPFNPYTNQMIKNYTWIMDYDTQKKHDHQIKKSWISFHVVITKKMHTMYCRPYIVVLTSPLLTHCLFTPHPHANPMRIPTPRGICRPLQR